MADWRPKYTVEPRSKYNARIGKPHASYDGLTTLCGQSIIGSKLFITTHTDHTGVATCKPCLRQLGKNLIGQ